MVAGILRGQRSRTFKLLQGTTVATAAQIMESGQGDRIHVTSTTAKLILAAGRERWLKQREDRLDSSKEQTYWVDPT